MVDWTLIGSTILFGPIVVAVWLAFCCGLGALFSNFGDYPRQGFIGIILAHLWIGLSVLFLWLGSQ